jgi:hypothetical protein
MITLLATFTSQKEDEIKKAQSKLVQKVVAAVLVFLVLTLVRFATGIVSGTMEDQERDDMWECVNYMLTGEGNMSKVNEASCQIVKDKG